MASTLKISLLALLIVLAAEHALAKEGDLHPDCNLMLLNEQAVAEMDPSELYGELFRQVQTSGIFSDSKYFVDMEPRFAPIQIMSRYLEERPSSAAALKSFVNSQFAPPEALDLSKLKISRGVTPDQYIRQMWPALTRNGNKISPAGSSLIDLGGKHILPGGRFREIYYWDSYFTSLGLLADQQTETFDSTVRIFENMLLKYGRIFNGNRDYFRGRSQPPFFALMVALWQSRYGIQSTTRFLPALIQEHAFWMKGAQSLARGQTQSRVVRLEDGGLLNRYWSDKAVPRPEAYKEDLQLAQLAALHLGRRAEDVYRDLGAGAESGWDFSTRWFADSRNLTSIQTTSLLPIDLNSLLWFLETKIAELSHANHDLPTAVQYQNAAEQRARLIHKYLYDDQSRTFRDYNWHLKRISQESTIAMVAPLFVGLATQAEADGVLETVQRDFLKSGGLQTTLRDSHEQWDRNGWAPCQWMTYAGAIRYGHSRLAEEIRRRWIKTNDLVFARTGEMSEKYNVFEPGALAAGGEYELQFGFGWSNGVYKAFMNPGPALFHLIGNASPPH